MRVRIKSLGHTRSEVSVGFDLPALWLPVDPPLGDEELTLRQQVDPGCKRNGIELLFPVDPAAGAPRPTIRPRAGPRPGIVCSLSVGRKLV